MSNGNVVLAELALQEALPLAVLPAASAWTTATSVLVQVPVWIDEVTYLCEYTATGAGGYCQLHMRWHAGGPSFYDDLMCDKSVVFVDPYAVVRTGLAVYEGPHAVAAETYAWTMPYEVPRLHADTGSSQYTTLQLLAREMGLPAAQGSLLLRVMGNRRH